MGHRLQPKFILKASATDAASQLDECATNTQRQDFYFIKRPGFSSGLSNGGRYQLTLCQSEVVKHEMNF